MLTVAELLVDADARLKNNDFAGVIETLKPFAEQRQNAPSVLLLKLAEAIMKSDRTSEALPILDRAYRQDPSDPDCSFLYGRALIDSFLFDRALPLLQRALAARPQSYKVHWALADYYTLCERSDLALPHFEAALANTSDKYQKAILSYLLGIACKNVNRSADAMKCFESIAFPEQVKISAAIQAFPLRKDGLESPAARQLADIASYAKNSQQQIDALLELAKAHDKAGNYEEAFRLCQKARSTTPVTVHDFKRLQDTNNARRRIFSRPLYEETRNLASTDEMILLVCGMPRSGTTLMEQVLGAHSRVASFGETARFTRLANAFLDNVAPLPDSQSAILDSARRSELKLRAEDNLKFLRSISDPGWTLAVEKTPMNFEAAGYMHLVHRGARFIHCKRHPADSFISSYQNQLNQFHDYAYSQETYAERFLEKERLFAYWKDCFPEQILEVKYEDLVLQPEIIVRSVLEFAGLPWEDATMRFFERESTVRTFSTQQVRQSFYSSSVDRWKHYEKHLTPLFKKLESEGFTYQ